MSSQKCGGLAGTSQRWWGFAPQLFALQADGLGHHQSRGGEVVSGSLLLVSTVDVTGDEEGDFPDLLTKENKRPCLFPCMKFTLTIHLQIYIIVYFSRAWHFAVLLIFIVSIL